MIFRKYVLPILLNSLFIPNSIASSYEIGSEFSLKAFPDKPQVYIRIEAAYEHKVLSKVYEISFHGVCIQQQYLTNSQNAPKFNLGNSFISESALQESISHPHKTAESILTCNDLVAINKLPEEQTSMLILHGGLDVQVSPINASLTMDASDKFSEVVFE